MIVFDVVVNNEIKETIKPASQNLHDIHWCMVDRVEELKVKYGDAFIVFRRLVEVKV